VWWYSGSEVATELAARREPSTAAESPPFGLRPGGSQSMDMASLIYTVPGRVQSMAQVICQGRDVKSQLLERDVDVQPCIDVRCNAKVVAPGSGQQP